MVMPASSSAGNALLKDLIRLHQRKGRVESGQILLEGPHLLAEALAAGASVTRVVFLPAWAGTAEGRALLARAAERGAPLAEADERFMARAATTDSPPPVAAVAERTGLGRPSAEASLGLILDGLQDPGNVGTILRAAWGAGADLVWAAPGTADLFSPKVLRSAQGAHFHLELSEMDRAEILARAKEGHWWLAAAESGGGEPFWRAKLKRPCLICIGGEARGVSQDLAKAAAERVHIPLAPGVDSINASVSAGVILFEAARRLWDQG